MKADDSTRHPTAESDKSTRDHSTYDVIISGAGPVGLFLACELALAKCSVLVLEKADNPRSPLKQIPFGIRGLSAPTIEALDRRGLLQELETHKRLRILIKMRGKVRGVRLDTSRAFHFTRAMWTPRSGNIGWQARPTRV
jgi:2-polyprenyl-6-methoxyphenol hydroxylase-like FAD-dependent oxidoreductase